MKNKHYKLIYVILIFCEFPLVLFPQSKIDSLRMEMLKDVADTTLYKLNYEIARLYTHDNLDSALVFAQKCIGIAQGLGDIKKVARSASIIGVTHLMKSNSEEGYKYLNMSLENYKAINDLHNSARTLNNIGIYYSQQGLLENALKCYLEAMNYWSDDTDISNKAFTMINIGIVYFDQTNYEQALDYFQKALAIFKEIGNTEGISVANSNIGDVYCNNESFDQALVFHCKALQCEQEINSLFGISHELNKIGVIYYRQQKFEQALDTLQKALLMRQQINNETGLCESNVAIGKTYMELNRMAEAEDHLNKAFVLAKENATDIWVRNSSKQLSILNEKRNNYQKALEYYKLYKLTNDSIFSASKIKEITELAMNYEFQKERDREQMLRENEKVFQEHIRVFYLISLGFVLLIVVFIFNRYRLKRDANTLLKKNYIIISQQADELKRANATKDKFFSIIAHDLKSPFNSILGFTELLENSYGDYSEMERKKFIGILSKSSKSAFFLLENLLTWSRAQLGQIVINKRIINLNELVEKSIAPYMGNAAIKNIRVINSIDKHIELFADEETLRTVIGNLVNNGIKFTNEGGEISITGSVRDNVVEICLSDTGIGMSKVTMDKLFRIEKSFTTSGTNHEKGTGLGLILCKEFVEKNDGRIWVQSTLGKGSSFKIELPGSETKASVANAG